MIEDTLECAHLIRELRRVVQRLTLVSHVSAMTLERATPSSDEDIGGKRPSGGVDHTGDREFSYRQKSAVYFQRRLDKMAAAKALYVAKDLAELLEEAVAAVEAWCKTPDVSGVKELEPLRDTYLWKCAVADDDRDLDTINRVYAQGGKPISRATLYRYRATYRGLRASVRRVA